MCPRFERKGKNMPYTSTNGHMFSQLNKDGQLSFSYSKETQEKYFRELNTTHFKSYETIMKSYVMIPEDLLTDKEKLAEMLNESYDYVMSLPPK